MRRVRRNSAHSEVMRFFFLLFFLHIDTSLEHQLLLAIALNRSHTTYYLHLL
jgi:hypothetical protein